jgi:hypothetical protein
MASHILDLSTGWKCERSVSRPGRFTPRERAPGTHWIGGWVNPSATLDTVAKRKKAPAPTRNRTPVVQLVSLITTPTELSPLRTRSRGVDSQENADIRKN